MQERHSLSAAKTPAMGKKRAGSKRASTAPTSSRSSTTAAASAPVTREPLVEKASTLLRALDATRFDELLSPLPLSHNQPDVTELAKLFDNTTLDPRMAALYGNVCFHACQYTRAVVLFRLAIKLPSSLSAQAKQALDMQCNLGLAIAFFELGQYSDCQFVCGKILKAKPDAMNADRALNLKIKSGFHLGLFAACKEAFQRMTHPLTAGLRHILESPQLNGRDLGALVSPGGRQSDSRPGKTTGQKSADSQKAHLQLHKRLGGKVPRPPPVTDRARFVASLPCVRASILGEPAFELATKRLARTMLGGLPRAVTQEEQESGGAATAGYLGIATPVPGTSISNEVVQASRPDRPIRLWSCGFGNGQDVFGTLVDVGHRLKPLPEDWAVSLTLVELQPECLARQILIFSAMHEWSKLLCGVPTKRASAVADLTPGWFPNDHGVYLVHLCHMHVLPERFYRRVLQDMILFLDGDLDCYDSLDLDEATVDIVCDVFDRWIQEGDAADKGSGNGDGRLPTVDARMAELLAGAYKRVPQTLEPMSFLRLDLAKYQETMRLDLPPPGIDPNFDDSVFYVNPTMYHAGDNGSGPVFPHPFVSICNLFDACAVGYDPVPADPQKPEGSPSVCASAAQLFQHAVHGYADQRLTIVVRSSELCALLRRQAALRPGGDAGKSAGNPDTHADAGSGGETDDDSLLLDRITVGSAPDATSYLNVLLAAIPRLKTAKHAAVISTLGSHDTMYTTAQGMLLSSLCMPDLDFARKMLGAQLFSTNMLWNNSIVFQRAPPTGRHERPKVEDVHDYLLQLFLRIVVPPQGYKHSYEHCPMTVRTWVLLARHLVRHMGYPAHWITAIVDKILSGRAGGRASLVTASPNTATTATFLEQPRAYFRTAPFCVELASVLALSYPELEFQITEPTPALADLGWLTVTINCDPDTMEFPLGTPRCGRHDPCVALAFVARSALSQTGIRNAYLKAVTDTGTYCDPLAVPSDGMLVYTGVEWTREGVVSVIIPYSVCAAMCREDEYQFVIFETVEWTPVYLGYVSESEFTHIDYQAPA